MGSLQQILIQLLPLTFILGLVLNRYIKWRMDKVRRPVKDKLLRPPGESLRLNLQELEEKSSLLISIMMVIPLAMLPVITKIGWEIPTITIAVICGPLSLLLFKRWETIGNYWLGFQGERAVAEELNQLMRKGCFVFHDLLMSDKKANIDHVVVAPTGVFVVETKTRRKRRAREGREDHKIIFNGSTLQFPHSTETKPLAQTERNAAWLSDQLSKALAEPIQVTPILTFPGWYIERTGRGKVNVVSHKNIAQVIASDLGSRLAEKQMKQISAWLEDRCRNVEF